MRFRWSDWNMLGMLGLLSLGFGCANGPSVKSAGSSGGDGAGGSAAAGGGGNAGGANVTLGSGAACGDGVVPKVNAGENAEVPASLHWCSTGPLLAPIADQDHPILSVKDPTLVYFDQRWHVFATTADSNGKWSMVYTSFASFDEAPQAKLYYLDANPALTGYHAAPQVFFFAPQNKWYLIFQSGQPQYSTSDDISRPESWTRPVNFFATQPETVRANKGAGDWLDFWVICDDKNCHLFFTDDDGELFRSQTTVADFPNGFGEAVIAIQGSKETVFEGSSTYLIEETSSFLTLVEAFGPSGDRFYRSYVADTLDGEWKPLHDAWDNPFAGMNNVTFANGDAWTADISHGELIRTNYDQTPKISLNGLRFLYQGRDPKKAFADYFRYPYRLGVLTRNAP
jgi:hypothetical protein